MCEVIRWCSAAVCVFAAAYAAAAWLTTVWNGRFRPRSSATNVDRLVGAVVRVTERVDGLARTGEVAAAGGRWSARLEGVDDVAEAGDEVVVLRVEGATLVVRPREPVPDAGGEISKK